MLFLAGGVDEANTAQDPWTTATGVSTGVLWKRTGANGIAGIYSWGTFPSAGTVTIEYLPYLSDANSWQKIVTLTHESPNYIGLLPNGKYRVRTAGATSVDLTIALVPV